MKDTGLLYNKNMKQRPLPLPPSQLEIAAMLAIFAAVFLWSAIHPAERLTWTLEVAPAVIGLGIFAWTYRYFRFQRWTYWMLTALAVVMMIGGHYTFSKVPLFDTLSTLMGWQRNNYDKLGHFFQGFAPAVVAQEILIRIVGVQKRGWVRFLAAAIALALSAGYELIEWGIMLAAQNKAISFIGMQGDIWDTQTDMLSALIGAITAILLFRF